MKDLTQIKVKTRTQTAVNESTQAGLDAVAKGSIMAMGGVSALIGLWAMASFVGAMITGGGPLAVVRGWFQAITGM